MTRETKIGLLLGLGVILLIGIILSDQISQRQQGQPADFTEFAGDAQRAIKPADATPAPGYGQVYTPGRPTGTPAENNTTANQPEDFLVPNDVREEMGMQQAANTENTGPAIINLPVLASNADQPRQNAPIDDVPTLTFGDTDVATPAFEQQRIDEAQQILDNVRNAIREAHATPSPGQSVIKHTVMPNENLTEIARRYYGNGDYWREIMRANPDKVGPDGSVRSGAVLDIPKREDAIVGMSIDSAARESVLRVDTPSAQISRQRTVEVKAGDTLSELASKYLGSASRWDEILDANRDKLETATDLQVGMKLKMPEDARVDRTNNPAPAIARTQASNSPSKTYTVKAGDNLTKIAQITLRNGDRWREIFEANRDKLDSPDQVKVGQTLRIPS